MSDAQIVRQANVVSTGVAPDDVHTMQINATMGQEITLRLEIPPGDAGADLVVVASAQDAAQGAIDLTGHELRIATKTPVGSAAGDGLDGVPLVGTANNAAGMHCSVHLGSSSPLGNFPAARYVSFAVKKNPTGGTGNKLPKGTFVIDGIRQTRSASEAFAAPVADAEAEE